MIIPDLILSWPRNCDYPLFRKYIRENRARFNEIIIVFTETNFGENYREFIKSAMFSDHVLFMESLPVGGNDDWRDRAIHTGLMQSLNAPWVLFAEQDFIILPDFWDDVNKYETLGVRVIGVKDADRLHPCCLFIRRDRLASLDLNFGILKDKLDHFGLIQKQLENEKEPIGVVQAEDYQHLNGLSHNMTLVYRGEKPNWKPEEFDKYIQESLNQGVVPVNMQWNGLFSGYLASAENNKPEVLGV